MKFFLCCLAAVLAGAAAEAESFVWNPSARQATYGAATVLYATDADTVTEVQVKATGGEDGTVEFTGSEPFAFAEGARVRFADGELVFKTPMSGTGFSVAVDPELIGTFNSTNAFDNWLYKTGSHDPVLVFPGKQVRDFEFDSAYLLSGALQALINVPRYVVRTDTTLSAEFQTVDSSYVKGVRITLVDSAEGICASVDYARYIMGTGAVPMSFDDLTAVKAKGGAEVSIVRSADSDTGYGVRYVSILPRQYHRNVLSVSNAVYTVGSASVGAGASLVLDGLAEGSSLAGGFAINEGELRFRGMRNVALTGAFTATNGKLAFELEQPESMVEVLQTNVVFTSNPKRILTDARLSDIIAVDVPKLTNSISYYRKPVQCFVRTNSEDCVQFQLQTNDGDWIKGCLIEFVQEGADVVAYKRVAMYWSPSSGAAGTVDMTDPAFTPKGSWTAGGNYDPAQFDVTYRHNTSIASYHVVAAINDATEKLILSNAKTEDILEIDVDHLVGSISSSIRPTMCFVKRASGSIEFQLQLIDGSWLKGARFMLVQRGANVYGCKTDSWWISSSKAHAPGVDDFTNCSLDFDGHNNSSTQYCIESMDLKVLELPHMYATVDGMNTSTANGLTVDVGANVSLTVDKVNGRSLPAKGIVNVAGELAITAAGAVGSSAVNVTTGGVLRLSGSNALAIDSPRVTLNGGCVQFADSVSYCNGLTFLDGAVAEGSAAGSAIRVGAKNTEWNVRGAAASRCDAEIRCVSSPTSGGEFTLTWSVADVTGDADVDFFMNGNMTEFPDGTTTFNGGLVHRKTGAGTLRWGGVSTCTGVVQVVEGTLLLGANNALNPATSANASLRAKQPLEFCGGTLAAEAHTTNTVQVVRLSSGASALTLADGAVLAADAFDAVGSGATLAVTLGEGAVFKTATTLSPAQLRAIRVNGLRAFQNDDGSLYGMRTGVMLIVR